MPIYSVQYCIKLNDFVLWKSIFLYEVEPCGKLNPKEPDKYFYLTSFSG